MTMELPIKYLILKKKAPRILGHCLANRMEIIDDCGLGIMWLTTTRLCRPQHPARRHRRHSQLPIVDG